MDWAVSGLVDSFYHVFDNNESGTVDLRVSFDPIKLDV